MPTCPSYDLLAVKAGIRLLTFENQGVLQQFSLLSTALEYARKGWCWIKDRLWNCFLHLLCLHLEDLPGIMESKQRCWRYQLWRTPVTAICKCHLSVAAPKGLWLPGHKSSFPAAVKSPGTASRSSQATSLPCKRF